ncbi:hypothetical protein N7540_011771 [Penicillium herquei]|nr:hypothetical protein N7540_011771 [Penicillium herquei]
MADSGRVIRPAVTRRKHLKSRKGCLQCKKRKIKCDENGSVSCAQCVKSRYTCSFAPPEAVDSTFSTNAVLDMELLHNFTSMTAASLTDYPEIQRFFSLEFVQLALKNDYLLHCVLSLSAFHIVYQHRNEKPLTDRNVGDSADKYLIAAHCHYDNALKGFRCSLSHLNSDSCHALFGCAFLLFIVSLSRPSEIFHQAAQPGSSVDVGLWLDLQISEWIILTKGLPSIVQHEELLATLREGPLAPIMTLRHHMSTSDDAEPSKNHAIFHLHILSEAIQEKSSDSRIVEICNASIQTLREVLIEVSLSQDVALSFLWPMRVHPDYLTLLGERRPEALLVFAYHCVLLHQMSARWFTQGWPQSMLESMKYTLDDAWMPLLKWPLDVVLNDRQNMAAGSAYNGI